MRRKTLLPLAASLALFGLSACSAPGVPPTATPSDLSVNATSTPQRPGRTATSIAGRPSPTGNPTAIAGITETPEPRVTTGPGTPAAKDPQVAVVEQQAIEIRGLKPKKEVVNNIIPREQLRKNLLDDFKKEYSREEARQDTMELWMLRLIDERDLDLYQLYIDFYTESIAGYYDDETDNMYIIADNEAGEKLSPQSRQTLAHEFIHAMQDQYYDLEKMLPDESKEYDRDLARRALVEGDAQRTDIMYAFKHFTEEEFAEIMQGSGDPTPAFDSAPAYIKEGFVFPYITGVTFVDELLAREGGFENVNQALADPPKSTEQIIHPEKYINTPRDEPLPIDVKPLTDTLGSGWKYGDGGSFGEIDIDLMLTENNVPGVSLLDFNASGEREAERAAAGWGGGWYELYENGEQALLLLDTRWDSTREADEYRASLEKSFTDASRDGDFYTDNGRLFAIGGEGDRVFLVSSTDKAALERVVAAVR
jgi:hypothetical protein